MRGNPASKFRIAPRGLLLALGLLVLTAIWQPAASSADTGQTITIAPNTPATDNCWPFGSVVGGGGGGWVPNMAFVYKNIPAFQLKPGDQLAFDTNGVNDFDVQLDVALAPTTANGNDVNAKPFTTIVTNSQTPANPRGDTTVGNYDLQFTAQAPFVFPGGGLIIRFSNPSASYAMDGTCAADIVSGNSTDTSGFFVERAFQDADGVSPWDGTDLDDIGAFRLTIAPKPTNLFTFGKLKRNTHKVTATLPVNVPGPGSLSLTGSGVKTQRGGGATASRTVTAAGTVKLLVKATGAKRHRLKKKGKVKVGLNVTFTPTYGDPNTRSERVKLIKKH